MGRVNSRKYIERKMRSRSLWYYSVPLILVAGGLIAYILLSGSNNVEEPKRKREIINLENYILPYEDYLKKK